MSVIFREQHQRLDFGVFHSQVHGLVDPANGTARDENAWRNGWLHDQEFVSGFQVQRHLFVEHHVPVGSR